MRIPDFFNKNLHKFAILSVIVLSVPVFIAFLISFPKFVAYAFVLLLLFRLTRGMRIKLGVLLRWYPKGKSLLFVYSDSPNWKEYIKTNILPNIERRAVILNWSKRSDWSWNKLNKPLELRVFQHWGKVKSSILSPLRSSLGGKPGFSDSGSHSRISSMARKVPLRRLKNKF